MEEWRTCPLLPEYEASSLGRVRRIPYEVTMPKGGTRLYGGKPHIGQLAVSETGQARRIFVFRGKTYKVARIVCAAFHGLPPPGKPYCLHRDEDAMNNRPDNLKWGSQAENLNAPGFKTYCRGRVGDANPYRKGART